jgi:hypothetical protein
MKESTKVGLLILFLGITFVLGSLFGSYITKEKTEIQQKKIEQLQQENAKLFAINQADVYQANYNSMLLFIMYNEGIVLKPTNGLIGFGHLIKKGEHYTTINYRDAFEIMQVDFANCITEAERLHFEGNKKLCAAHMLYNMRYDSAIKALLNMSLIMRYDGYMDDGVMKKSDNLRKARELDDEFWNSNYLVDIYKYL